MHERSTIHSTTKETTVWSSIKLQYYYSNLALLLTTEMRKEGYSSNKTFYDIQGI
jgi:hypothetical protein